MKKTALVFIVTLVLGLAAKAADIAFYVGAPNVDGWYTVAAQTKDVETIIAQTGSLFKDIQKFDDAHLKDFGAWIDKNTDDGELDIIWLNGCTPSVLYQFPNVNADGSRAEKWLDGGNMIINVGDWFAYCTYEGGSRQADNGPTGAANILDLSSSIIYGGGQGQMAVTPAGKQYLPSLNVVTPDRPILLSAVVAPWEVAAVFAQNAAGTYADPVVIHNTQTDGYVAFINQAVTANWIADRGLTCAEFIANWVSEVVGLGPQPLARGPNPKSGSMIDQTKVQASWRAGDFAKLHDVYFGDDPAKVAAATPSDTAVYVGRQAVAQLPMGMAGGPAPEGLVPGKTYYWRVDEVDEGDPASPWKGDVWSFWVRPLTAFKPFPPDGMKYVDPDQNLSWEIGQGTIFHTIYVGKSFDEVHTAVAGGMMSAEPRFEPGTLTLDTTYYWRVDEFAFPTNKTTKGPVWSFTTRGSGGGAKAVYFKGMDLAGDPVLSQTEGKIDHNWSSGEVAAGLSDNVSARWTANLEAPFTETYNLITSSDDGVRLWFDGKLVIDNWTDHGTTDNTAQVKLIAGQIYHIRMEWYENGGGAVAQLSWQSPTLGRQIIPQGWLQLPLRAAGPSPANAEPHAPQDAVLQWIAGEEATEHDVYFGTDATAVATADTTTADIYKGRQKADKNTFDPGELEWGKTYYWRVDEINAASPWKGCVWSFTAADFLIVEDFESYTDQAGEEIFSTWIDGFVDKSSGSTVGYTTATNGTFGETAIVHGGYQSMPLDYNNVNAPFFSEAKREFSPVQNWTVNGVDSLTLYFRGQFDNGKEKLYVTLTDSAGKSATVVHPDPAAACATKWTQWKIPLSSFTGVNAAKIKALIIGLGDRSNPKKGGAGLLLIDDIWITKP